jgi:hypothetical protein
MNNIFLASTHFTPEVNCNATTGILDFKGRSTAENAFEFYKPIIHWLREYCKTPHAKTTVNLQLEYFNSSSSKCLIDILHQLSKIKESNSIVINWLYEKEDIDMKETGEDMESLTRMPFVLIEVH